MEMRERKCLPIGIADFRDIRRNNFCYIDKTFFIQRLLDTQARIMLFTRPRRFGKTLALDTLRCFFDCNAKDENRPLFDGLAVAQSERYMAEQGRYPVIHFDFKTVEGTTQAEVKLALRNALRDALAPFKYLLSSDKIDKVDKGELELLFKGHDTVQASINYICTSLGYLCSILAQHHGQPVVILIDEYDAPLQSAYKFGFYQPISTLMRKLFSSALKSNRNLRLGVLTGVLRIAKDSLFSGMNNLKVDTILSDKFADCFGFTQSEVRNLAEYYAVPEKREEIGEWYDGYRFGELDIYNPWSVLQYFDNNCEAQAYWLDTSSNDLAKEFLRTLENEQRDEVEELYHGGCIEATVDTAVSYPQLASKDPDVLFSLLAVSGYLKPVKRICGNYYRLMIPNKEIQTIYADEILRYLENRLNIGHLAPLGSAIVQGQELKAAELLNEYMIASLSYYDTVESFYHGWMLGLLLTLSENYTCKSNREAGEGRADIMLVPRQGCQGPGLVFEFKCCEHPEQMPAKAEEALQQIEDKRYFADFAPEVGTVLGYGIAFCRKECEIRQRKWRR